MACGCAKKRKTAYVWTSEDGAETVEYATEVQARARQLRTGGTYEPKEK